jgi:hypothetical protein
MNEMQDGEFAATEWHRTASYAPRSKVSTGGGREFDGVVYKANIPVG